LGVFSY